MLGLMQDRFDISSLKGVRVHSDYEGSVAASLPDGGAGEVSAAAIAATLAYNVSVETGGRDDVIVFLRPHVALALLDPEEASFAPAVGLVLAQLARLGTGTLLADVFSRDPATWADTDRMLVGQALPAWQTFVLESYASMSDPDRRVRAVDLLVEALHGLKDRLAPVRRAFWSHRDFDRLLGEMLPIAADVLSVAAAAAAAVPELAPAAREIFEARLERLEHRRWFDLLRADLASIWSEGDRYPTPDAFLALRGHMERLLVHGAIFLWDEQGAWRVQVPFWADPDLLAAGALHDGSDGT